MSDRLAIAATASVLMMSVYVLFGQAAVREPIGKGAPDSAFSAALPDIALPGRLLPLPR